MQELLAAFAIWFGKFLIVYALVAIPLGVYFRRRRTRTSLAANSAARTTAPDQQRLPIHD